MYPRSIAEQSYSLLKHATHPHCIRSDIRGNIHDYKLWLCTLCRVVCHDLDNCVSTLISQPVTVAPLVKAVVSGLDISLCSGWGGRNILERRPSVMSLSHSSVPTKPHDSSLCGECGWLLSCDYSLTHLSKTPSHSSSLTPSFHVNHQANLSDECLSLEIPLRLMVMI